MEKKKIFLLLMLCLITLTGCSSNKEQNKADSSNHDSQKQEIKEETKKEETFTGYFSGAIINEYTGLYNDFFEFKEDKTFFRQINMTNGISHIEGTYEITTYENQKAIKVIAKGFETYPEIFLIKDNDTLEHISQDYDQDNLWLMLSSNPWKRLDSSQISYEEDHQLDGAIRPTDE